LHNQLSKNDLARLVDHESKETIWIHLYDTRDMLIAQQLIAKIKNKHQAYNFFIATSNSFALQKTQHLSSFPWVEVLVKDDLDTIALLFNILQPIKAVIILRHEINGNLIMYSKNNNVPLFLLGAEFKNETARLFSTKPYLGKSLLNSIDSIFATSQQDINIFRSIGVKKPNMYTVGNLDAYNIIQKKEMVLKKQSDIISKINEKHPKTILVNLSKLEDLKIYIDMFQSLKKYFNNIKMILYFNNLLQPAICNYLMSCNNINYAIDTKNYPIGESLTKALSIHASNDNIFQTYQNYFSFNDIVITTNPETLFALQAISSLYIVNGTYSTIEKHNFIEAAIWKTPIIVGPLFNQFFFEETQNTQNSITTKITQEIALMRANNDIELLDKIVHLLDNEAYRKAISEHSYHGAINLSNECNKTMDAFMDIFLEQSKSLKSN
jgi:3-deoxy-D-manno-octulosonic-acid transferase